MNTSDPYHRPSEIALAILLGLEALTFLLAGILHLGIQIPGVPEPRIIPAFLVETLCGLFLGAAGLAVIIGSPRRWTVALSAHVFAILGVFLGMVELALGLGPSTDLNVIYHRTILMALLLGLVSLWVPRVRQQLRERHA